MVYLVKFSSSEFSAGGSVRWTAQEVDPNPLWGHSQERAALSASLQPGWERKNLPQTPPLSPSALPAMAKPEPGCYILF